MKLVAEIATPLCAKLGVKTGKDAKNGYATPNGRVLAAIVCSLASRNQTLAAVHEGTDGCGVQAEIPPGMTTWRGKLSLTLERKAEGTDGVERGGVRATVSRLGTVQARAG